jgi:hypothetical protein
VKRDSFSSESEDSPKKPPVEMDKRSGERRQEDRGGYVYISTVGWICRRERSRRKSDEEPVEKSH